LAVYLQGVTVEPSSNITSDYFVTASLPSSASLRRVWQFTTQGTITGPEVATLTLDYTQAHINCPDYNITFEGALNGTFTVKNQVFSANKFISYELTSTYVLVLSIKIPKSIQECFGPGTTQNYSFSINLNDASSTSTIELSYGMDSSGTGYTYIAGTDGAPDELVASSSSLTYEYVTISNQDIVQLTILGDSTGDVVNITLLYPSSSNGGLSFYSLLPLPISLSTIYLSSLVTWPLYIDYTTSIVAVKGFAFQEIGFGVTEIVYDAVKASPSLSVTIEFTNAAQPNAYIVVDTDTSGGLTSNDTLDVAITYSGNKSFASTNYVYVYDANTNGYQITLSNTTTATQTSNTSLVYNTTSGWELAS
jgi:hypothetical protein